MVWLRMGLLDDAIRDHLELKRLRGADPGEVAREQREALEPDIRGERVAVEEAPEKAVEEHGIEDASNVAEETAELDMSSVLDGDTAEEGHDDAGGTSDSGAGPPPLDDLNEDQLHWEVPGDPSAEMRPDAGQDDRAARNDGR
jgi:hypothetical protein